MNKEVFKSAHDKLIGNKHKFNNNNRLIKIHLFHWLVECWDCWSKYKAYKEKNNHVYYRCTRINKYKFWDTTCKNSQVSENFLVEKTFDAIDKLIKNPEIIIKQYMESDSEDKIKEYTNEKNNIEKKIDITFKQINQIYDDLLNETSQKLKIMYETKIKDRKNDINLMEKRKNELIQLINNENHKIDIKNEVLKLSESLKWISIHKLSPEEQAKIINLLVEKIIIKKDDIDVILIITNDTIDEDLNNNNSKSLTGVSNLVD